MWTHKQRKRSDWGDGVLYCRVSSLISREASLTKGVWSLLMSPNRPAKASIDARALEGVGSVMWAHSGTTRDPPQEGDLHTFSPTETCSSDTLVTAVTPDGGWVAGNRKRQWVGLGPPGVFQEKHEGPGASRWCVKEL